MLKALANFSNKKALSLMLNLFNFQEIMITAEQQRECCLCCGTKKDGAKQVGA